MDFREFLKQHKVEKGAPFTHTCMAGSGAYFVPEDEMGLFYDLYVEHIENNQGALHLTEKSTPIGPPRVDLDFIYKKDILKHQHTQEQVQAFTGAWMAELAKLVQVPATVPIYVMEKARPTLDKERSKSGVHILVPDLKVSKQVEQTVRRNLLPRMPEFFPGLPLEDGWEKVQDTQPLSHSAQWTLYGSLKKDSLPYRIQYIFDWTPEGMTVNTTRPGFDAALVKRLSVCTPDAEATPLTDVGRETQENIPLDPGSDRVSGGKAALPTRGRQASRGPPGSRGSSPGAGLQQRPLTDEEREFVKAHVQNLADFRSTNQEEWIRVGICLKNIHVDLMEVFLDFSSRWEKQNERDCIQRWQGLTFKADGQRIEMGTLLQWSRTDNPEGYERIRENHITALMDAAVSGTEHDVARVVHAKFRDTQKCVKFGNNDWYRFSGHIWTETEKGVDLLCKLSSEIWKLFLRREREYITRLETQDPCGHKKGDRDMNCGFCKTSAMKEAMNSVCLNLKKTKFKENVMKECKELFLDEQFAVRADENRNLIAFNNGVYDTTTYEFRPGRPEDYITFSTHIDYDPDLPHEAHACWPEVRAFIESVLPDPEIREQFLAHLSTLLEGGNPAQKFHIMTGSGSNGKSMLMNLVTRTLGDYAYTANITLLTQGRQKTGTAAPDVVKMKGKRFITMAEPDEGAALNSGLMKDLSGGENISVRDLQAGSKSMVSFKLQAKMHLACNEKPKIQTNDGGTWRRLAVVEFTSKFVANPTEPHERKIDESLQHKVESEAWARCFLSYLVHLFETGKGHRKIQPPAQVLSQTQEQQAENDVLARFMQEHLRSVDTTQDTAPQPELVTKLELARQFKEWKRVNDVFKGSIQELTKRVENRWGRQPRDGWAAFRLERLI